MELTWWHWFNIIFLDIGFTLCILTLPRTHGRVVVNIHHDYLILLSHILLFGKVTVSLFPFHYPRWKLHFLCIHNIWIIYIYIMHRPQQLLIILCSLIHLTISFSIFQSPLNTNLLSGYFNNHIYSIPYSHSSYKFILTDYS